MYNLLKHIKEGDAESGDIELLNSVAQGIEGKCLCALGEFSIMAIVSGIEHFRKDFDAKFFDEPRPDHE